MGFSLSGIVARHLKKKLEKWTIKEEDVVELLKQIRITLLDADVNLLVVKNFIKDLKTKVIGIVIEPNQDPENVIIGIIKEELTNILGKNKSEIVFDKNKVVLMLVGLQGSGKTTTCAKLANYYKKKHNKKPLLIGIDIYRPAAIEQLQTLAKENEIDFFAKGTQDPVITADEALTYAKQNNNDVLIFDTAGRLQTNEELMDELKKIRNKINPDEIIMVVDSMSGQSIYDVANVFNETLDLTGFILTKMDGDVHGGAALSLTSLLNIPIKMIGTGEKISQLDEYYPDRIAERILGLGDILTLAEKIKDNIDEKGSKTTLTKMLSGKLDLEDLLFQLKELRKIGSFGMVAKMIPGLANKINDTQISEAEEKIHLYEILLNSMTKKERRNPSLFKKEPTRRIRVVKGSGRKPEEFNRLLKEWENSKEKFEQMSKMLRSGKNPFNNIM